MSFRTVWVPLLGHDPWPASSQMVDRERGISSVALVLLQSSRSAVSEAFPSANAFIQGMGRWLHLSPQQPASACFRPRCSTALEQVVVGEVDDDEVLRVVIDKKAPVFDLHVPCAGKSGREAPHAPHRSL